jgi:SPP1 gp7 family putative phage head morphogenesis protein
MIEEVLTYNSILNYDPTRTTSLRNAFARNMNRRFDELIAVIKESVNVRDCFGLKEGVVTFQMSPTGARAFAFLRSSEKVEAFMKWLQEQVDKGILTIGQGQQIGLAVEAAWTNMYVADSYKRGIMRARYELKKAGVDLPPLDETYGIDAVFNTPFHMDRVGLLFTRVFSDLKGVTDAMDMQISRVLAQGMIDGDGPALLARKMVAIINGDGVDKLGLTDTLGRFIPAQRRAMMIARTETIRAFHQATIQEYRNWAIEGVYVKAEWMTAGDDRVCDECNSLQGKIFTLDEIEPLIPLHPNCRCIALPYIEDIVKYYKK